MDLLSPHRLFQPKSDEMHVEHMACVGAVKSSSRLLHVLERKTCPNSKTTVSLSHGNLSQNCTWLLRARFGTFELLLISKLLNVSDIKASTTESYVSF